jgi:hypothetical protein
MQMKTLLKFGICLAISFVCLSVAHSQDMAKIDRLTKEMTESNVSSTYEAVSVTENVPNAAFTKTTDITWR